MIYVYSLYFPSTTILFLYKNKSTLSYEQTVYRKKPINYKKIDHRNKTVFWTGRLNIVGQPRLK